MAHYLVYWSSSESGPRASNWYTLDGVITHASPALKEWQGGDHKALVRYLHRHGYSITHINNLCAPTSIAYHNQLKSCVDSLLQLMNERK